MPPENAPRAGGPSRPPRDAAADYRAKGLREAEIVSRRLADALLPAPTGDPTSGVVLLVEGPAGPRAQGAIEASLAAVGLAGAFVTWTGSGAVRELVLSTEPGALVAVGALAAGEIDAADYPLARRRFADAPEGEWFSWTKGTAGLRLPSVQPALSDAAAKRRFWSAFLRLRDLSGGEG